MSRCIVQDGGKFFAAIVFILFQVLSAQGQERKTELYFLKQRANIKSSGISEITESFCFSPEKPCPKEIAAVTARYRFDNEGNLIQIDRYENGKLSLSIQYAPGTDGMYQSKQNRSYNSAGEITTTDTWEFRNDDAGRRIREVLKRGSQTLRSHDMTYDNRGNLTRLTIDKSQQLEFVHDDNRNVTEMRECIKQNNKINCTKVTRYQYTKDLLISEIVQSPTGNEVWEEFRYNYDDNGNLISIEEKNTSWITVRDEERKEVQEFNTRIENDANGNPLKKFRYSSVWGNPGVVECYYYDYKLNK